MREFKISPQAEKNIKQILRDAAKELKNEMTICEVDNMKVSLDLDFSSTGKFAGVKFSMFRAERTEWLYDEDIP